AGRPFSEVREILAAAGVRVGGDHPTSEHAVAVCEDGFGYHLAMILASIVDLVESLDPELATEIASLQRQVKNGLASAAANSFYEAGFADRVVAGALGESFPDVAHRAAVRGVCRSQFEKAELLLSAYPAYFSEVLRELAGR